MLGAISPIDGRYRERLAPLADLFSERALIEARCRVELSWARALEGAKLFAPLTPEELERIGGLESGFSAEDAELVKSIERTTHHDVKAVEYFLRERLRLANPNRIHFGLTSEDVNNLAYALLLGRFVVWHQIPAIERVVRHLCARASETEATPFPTRTHGQLASPSTAGKELAVPAARLARLVNAISRFRFSGKLNGAVGNYSALVAAAPGVDWPEFCRRFVEGLGLEFNPVTTQIEDHDRWAEFFNLTRQVNNVVIDLDQDMWSYLMLGLYRERVVAGEVGSSTMPHKVNPIRFENAEGNLLLANAELSFLSDKLCRSRLQRDLSDSTVTRNVGVALARSYLGWVETMAGLERVSVDVKRCLSQLEENPFLLAEPIQTILRLETTDDPYESLKELTRGHDAHDRLVERVLERFSVGQKTRARLESLTVETYLGEAVRICREAVRAALSGLEASK